ncbi:MAG TPA: bifunctional DNA primase/polymerase, partial [Hyphomicrobiaceae bacterium]
MIDFTKEALRFASIGWSVFPLGHGSKMPAIKGGHGVKDASLCPDDIRAWGRIHPRANIGVACGPSSGIVVIDIDPRNGGHESLARLAAKGRVLPCGPRARTGNGGAHHFFRFDPRIANSKNRLGAGIDVKSTGGYVVVAPSEIGSSKNGAGGSYYWDISPFDVVVPRLPIWLTTMLAPSAPPPRCRPHERSSVGSAEVDRLAKWVARGAEGERNNRLHWAACRVGEMAREHKVAATAAGQSLVSAAVQAGLE